MKTGFKVLMLVALIIICKCSNVVAQENLVREVDPELYYYAVEMNGVISGFAEGKVSNILINGKEHIEIDEDLFIDLRLLGNDLKINVKHFHHVDPLTNRFILSKIYYNNGGTEIESVSRVYGDSILFTSTSGDQRNVIKLTPGTILESPLSYPHLIDDFKYGNLLEKSYKVYNSFKGIVEEKHYELLREDQIELCDELYDALVFEDLNLSTGERSILWIKSDSGRPLQFDLPRRKIYLANKSVAKQVQTADFDKLLMARVNKVIPDVHGITFMKVRGKIQYLGEYISVDDLNFPGQKFVGTVTKDTIDGTFEIESIKYDGSGAPGYPWDFQLNAGMKKYLEPEHLIESDNILLVDEATAIVEGSADSWEAAIRLSDWVANNIKGALPGGTSAINTYLSREGECGSHSRLLAAFCRAVGIPARLSVGCMYSTYNNGSFYQHAWTEVFMGDAGWTAVDATAFEIDFVDAGHIRISELTGFNPIEMEILEYKIGDQEVKSVDNKHQDKYLKYLGKYTNTRNGKVFNILYQDGRMAVDIPNSMVLALIDPDNDGLWYPQLTRSFSLLFEENDFGEVLRMRIQQKVPLIFESDVENNSVDAPAEILQLTGVYQLPQQSASFKVFYSDGDLWMDSPITKSIYKIFPTEKSSTWMAENGVKDYVFSVGHEGTEKSLLIVDNIYLPKGEPVSGIIRKEIEESGIDAGLQKYVQMKNDNTRDYLFYESDLNLLAHWQMMDGKIKDAIDVYKLMIREYPDSWLVYNNIGEAYYKNGNNRKARKYFKKSLKINPENENGKAMMEKIKNGVDNS